MQEYLVSWEIDVDANSPQEAIDAAYAVLSDQVHGYTHPAVMTATDEEGNETTGNPTDTED